MRIPHTVNFLTMLAIIIRSICLGGLLGCLLIQKPGYADATAADGQDGKVITYRCLLPSDHTLLYRLEIKERTMGSDGGTEKIEVEQTWQWPSGNNSLYRDILMMGPAPGRAFSGLRKEYDRHGGIILETKLNIEADPEAFPTPAFPYTSLFTVHRRGIKILIDSGRFDFYAIFPGKVVMRLHSRFAGKEQVKVLDKTVDCYKVQMSPDLSYFMGNIGRVVNLFVKLLMPESCMWFRTEPPYTMVRYEGLSSVKNSIQPVIYEIEDVALHYDQSKQEPNDEPTMGQNTAVVKGY